MTNSSRMPTFLAIDFYCGAGGSTRGLLDAGGYVIAGIDNDEDCRTTYQHNNRNFTLDRAEPTYLALDMFPAQPEYPQGQQQQIRVCLRKLISRYRKMAPNAPMLFVICAPCQSFTKFVQRQLTTAQAQSRERDQNLLLQTASFVEEFKPEMVISENVVGIGKGKYRPIWEDFQSRLRNLGYAVGDNQDWYCDSLSQGRGNMDWLELIDRIESDNVDDLSQHNLGEWLRHNNSYGRVLGNWWPSQGRNPSRDIEVFPCAIKGRHGLLLRENREPTERDTTATDGQAQIADALAEANSYFGGSWSLSPQGQYQLSNRIAWAWRLAFLGFPVVLLYLGYQGHHEDVIPNEWWGRWLYVDNENGETPPLPTPLLLLQREYSDCPAVVEARRRLS